MNWIRMAYCLNFYSCAVVFHSWVIVLSPFACVFGCTSFYYLNASPLVFMDFEFDCQWRPTVWRIRLIWINKPIALVYPWCLYLIATRVDFPLIRCHWSGISMRESNPFAHPCNDPQQRQFNLPGDRWRAQPVHRSLISLIHARLLLVIWVVRKFLCIFIDSCSPFAVQHVGVIHHTG